MQSAALRSLLVSGFLVSVAGCFPNGYQNGPGPYGQYPPPQYLGTPAYTVPAGQPYAPGGTTPPTSGGPTLLPPNANPQPTYDNNGNKINWDNNAPSFNPAAPNGTTGGTSGGNSGGAPGGNSGGSSGNRGAVPDPGTLEDPAGSGPAASNTKLTPTSATQRVESEFERESNNNSGQPEEPARIGTEPDPFEPPQRVSNTEMVPAVIHRVNHEAVAGEDLKPYGRDLEHANPQWLRGIVDYDDQEQTWQIIYAANPDPRDQNGGSLTLGKHPELARCRTGDIVTVKGAIDNSQTDLRGKPIYALDAVTVLRKSK